MRKVEINKSLSRLNQSQFKKWFESRDNLKDQNWEEHYKLIGGVLKPKKKIEKED